MKLFLQLTIAASALVGAVQASAAVITFEELAVGTKLTNQYTPVGATFAANAFNGPGSSSSGKPWATNTDMTIVSSTGNDVAGLGTPAGLVSGNILRSFLGWQTETGDPSFMITFGGFGASSFSAAFAGVLTPADVRIFAYDEATLLSIVAGPTTTTGQFVLSYAAPNITSVVIAPGSFNDWVGVDNINFTLAAIPQPPLPIPEPQTYALISLGLGMIALARRRARAVV